MSNEEADKIAKLPRWAREMIKDQTRRADSAERKLAELSGHTGTGKVKLGTGVLSDLVNLPDNATVRFFTDDCRCFVVRMDHGALDINASNVIAVMPQAGNVISVRMVG